MKISCDIIRDLLPLYAEDMTSQASNQMVAEHLRECEGCSKYLRELRAPAQIPEEVSVQNLTRIKKVISKRRLLSVLTAVCLALSLVAGGYSFLNAEIFISADQAIQAVEPREDGTVCVYWNPSSFGYSATRQDGDAPGNWGIIVSVTRSEQLFPSAGQGDRAQIRPEVFGEDIEDSLYRDSQDNYWYVNWKDGTADRLLWDGGTAHPAQGVSLRGDVNYSAAWLCGVTGILGAAFTLAAWLLREYRAGKGMRYLALFFGSSFLAALAASGGQFVNYSGSFQREFPRVVIALIPLVLAGYFGFELWDLNHPKQSWEPDLISPRVKRRILAVVTPVLLTVSIAIGVYTFLNMGILYLTAEEALIGVEELENGDVKFQYSNLVSMHCGFREEDAVGELKMGWAKQVLAYRFSREKPQLTPGGSFTQYTPEEMAASPSIWYLNPKDGTAQVQLWDGGTERPQEPMATRSCVLAWYCLGTALGSVLLWYLASLLPWIRKYLRWGALVCGSLCIAGILVSGGQFYTFSPWEIQLSNHVFYSLPAAIAFFLTGLCGCKLRDLKK